MYTFNAQETLDRLVDWVKNYFAENAAPETKAVIGISGGKDSSVAAAVCVKALGKERVIGVLMPQNEQSDIAYSRLLVDTLGIKSYTINIGETVSTFMAELSKHLEPSRQAQVNTPRARQNDHSLCSSRKRERTCCKHLQPLRGLGRLFHQVRRCGRRLFSPFRLHRYRGKTNRRSSRSAERTRT